MAYSTLLLNVEVDCMDNPDRVAEELEKLAATTGTGLIVRMKETSLRLIINPDDRAADIMDNEIFVRLANWGTGK